VLTQYASRYYRDLALVSNHQYSQADEKIEEIECILGSDSPITLQCKARLYAHSGDFDKTNKSKDKLIELSKGKADIQYQPAIRGVCIAMDELEEGISWLDKALEAQNSQVVITRASIRCISDQYPSYIDSDTFQAFLKK